MNVIDKYGEILFDGDYYTLSQDLSEEWDVSESLRALYAKYKVNAPSFLDRLLAIAHQESISDCHNEHYYKRYSDDMLNLTVNYLSDDFAENADSSQITEALGVLKEKTDIEHTDELYGWIKLYFEILKLKRFLKEKEDEENPGAILTVREKLFLLDMLVSKKQLTNLSDTEFLKLTLSLITGTKMDSLENPLKTHNNWFDVFQRNLTPSVITDRIKSLQKVNSIIAKKHKDNPVSIRISELITEFETEKNKHN